MGIIIATFISGQEIRIVPEIVMVLNLARPTKYLENNEI